MASPCGGKQQRVATCAATSKSTLFIAFSRYSLSTLSYLNLSLIYPLVWCIPFVQLLCKSVYTQHHQPDTRFPRNEYLEIVKQYFKRRLKKHQLSRGSGAASDLGTHYNVKLADTLDAQAFRLYPK